MTGRLALLLLAAALLAAAPAHAGHYGVPVPDGAMTVRVLFIQVTAFAPAPTSHVDDAWAGACAATEDLPAGCSYERRVCLPNDLPMLCEV